MSHLLKVSIICFDLGALIGYFHLYRQPVRALREWWSWLGIGRPRPPFSLFHFETKEYNQGRRLFQKASQPISVLSANNIKARQAAAVNVTRLAPELHMIDGTLQTGRLTVAPNGMFDRQAGASYCCENTFRKDCHVPDLEKMLTYYLYWKLFPKHFVKRPHHYD